MTIVLDMDNTLADEFGSEARPGMVEFLEKLKKEGHTLVLWSNSRKERAVSILKENRLYSFFSQFVYREDYDPENKGIRKDIRKVKGDVLIDDDPEEIEFVCRIGKRGIKITPFRKGKEADPDELNKIHGLIHKKKRFMGLFG